MKRMGQVKFCRFRGRAVVARTVGGTGTISVSHRAASILCRPLACFFGAEVLFSALYAFGFLSVPVMFVLVICLHNFCCGRESARNSSVSPYGTDRIGGDVSLAPNDSVALISVGGALTESGLQLGRI